MHRDIKPENILIDNNSRVMICDFGIARSVPKLSQDEKEIKEFRKNEYKAVKKGGISGRMANF